MQLINLKIAVVDTLSKTNKAAIAVNKTEIATVKPIAVRADTLSKTNKADIATNKANIASNNAIATRADTLSKANAPKIATNSRALGLKQNRDDSALNNNSKIHFRSY